MGVASSAISPRLSLPPRPCRRQGQGQLSDHDLVLHLLLQRHPKGYYKDEGLDLDVVEAAGGVATPALVSGDVQFSTSGSSAISAIMKGARLKVLAVGEDRPSWQIWTTKPEIKTFQDLKGLQVGVLSRGDTGEVAIRYVLKKLGLPADFVSYTPMGSSLGTRMAVVRAGSLPAASLQPAEVETLRAAGGLANAHMIMDLAQEVRSTFNGLATSDDMIKNHADTVLRFVRATRKGMLYARDNREGAIDVFVKVMKAPPDAAAPRLRGAAQGDGRGRHHRARRAEERARAARRHAQHAAEPNSADHRGVRLQRAREGECRAEGVGLEAGAVAWIERSAIRDRGSRIALRFMRATHAIFPDAVQREAVRR